VRWQWGQNKDPAGAEKVGKSVGSTVAAVLDFGRRTDRRVARILRVPNFPEVVVVAGMNMVDGDAVHGDAVGFERVGGSCCHWTKKSAGEE